MLLAVVRPTGVKPTGFLIITFSPFLYLDVYVLGDNAGYFMQTKHLCVLIHI